MTQEYASHPQSKDELRAFCEIFFALENQVSRVMVGMEDVIRGVLASIFAGGHVLMEGAPGLGKTLLVKSINDALGLSFKRIQFTPDLMPSDVTGTQIIAEDEHGRRSFTFKPGPIFANLVLADEINRATPKTQAALLEAMEERQVTVLDETYLLDAPFFVLATQNPVELEGTYPLPEAQLDRFLAKLLVPMPEGEDLKIVLQRTTGAEKASVECVFGGYDSREQIERMRKLVRQVVASDPILDVMVRVVGGLTPGSKFANDLVNNYVRFGPGPRGAQAGLLLAKVYALLDQRMNLSFEDLQRSLLPALRHRLILNFQAEADGVTADEIVRSVSTSRK